MVGFFVEFLMLLVLDLSDVWKWRFGLKTWIFIFGVLDQKFAVFQWIKYGLL